MFHHLKANRYLTFTATVPIVMPIIFPNYNTSFCLPEKKYPYLGSGDVPVFLGFLLGACRCKTIKRITNMPKQQLHAELSNSNAREVH